MGYGLWVMGYGLWVMGYGLWVMGYGLWQNYKISESTYNRINKLTFFQQFHPDGTFQTTAFIAIFVFELQ